MSDIVDDDEKKSDEIGVQWLRRPIDVAARLKTHEFGQRRPILTSHHRRRRFLQAKPI